ncbi:hypothetical protein Rifp1Sym_av00270 [endosymbiont of Riftia pachyptila (vent Ph05)]|uniref:Uncharacterized protein n=1 Tax=endosymbiont of Riftia pachyptila (vent Ph05) TaxID=1048808 RepID=G2DBW0_9GAMM|nr:hypothetical protein Rifp1Sym_av00270 [endosymbiont of Riftia pachyptila (vent Ph05)]
MVLCVPCGAVLPPGFLAGVVGELFLRGARWFFRHLLSVDS